jgi:hypothetical protein
MIIGGEGPLYSSLAKGNEMPTSSMQVAVSYMRERVMKESDWR